MTGKEKEALRALERRIRALGRVANISWRRAWQHDQDDEEAARQNGRQWAFSEVADLLRGAFPDVFGKE